MRSPASWIASCVTLVTALLPSSVLGQQAMPCLVVENDQTVPLRVAPAPGSAITTREVDVKQIVRLTPAGVMSLGDLPLAYIRVVRTEPEPDGSLASFVRLFDEAPRSPIGGQRRLETEFRFSRKGLYQLHVHGASEFPWPAPPPTIPGKEVCPATPVSVIELPPEERPDFPGVRGQWWASYRVSTELGLGAAVFVRRIGVAASAELNPTRLGDRSDPTNVNPVTGTVDIRYRGARGYIGGGVRYYPDEEPDRDQLRIVAVAGEELPSFKGRPLWLLLNLRLEERRKNILAGIRVEFAFRFDLWGSRP